MMMNLGIALSKILAEAEYTPSEIKELLAQAGHDVSLEKLTDHLNLLVAIGSARKHQDGKFSTLPF